MIRKFHESASEFFFGLLAPARALRLILTRRNLLLLSVVPILLTLILSLTVVKFAQSALLGWGTDLLLSWGVAEQSFTATIAIFVMKIASWILGVICFSLAATVVASPFNDFLAEATEPLTNPPLPALLPHQETWRFRLRNIGIDIVKSIAVTSLQLALLFAALLAIWVPGLNVLLFVSTLVLLTYQYLSYPQTRRGIGARASLGFLRRHFAASLGFGLAAGALFSLPLISALALPLVVVGGTLLYSLQKP